MKTRRKTSSRVLAFLLSFIMVATTFVNDYTVVRAEEDSTVSDEASSSESSDSSSDSRSNESSDEASSDDVGSSDGSDAADSAEVESTDETPEEGETDADEEDAEDEELEEEEKEEEEEEEEEEIPLEDLVINEDQIVITFRASEGGSVSMPYQILGEEDDVASVMAIAEDGYEFENWTKDGEEVSTDEEFTPAKEDAEYVANFVPVEEEEYPAQSFSKTVNGVKITVEAPEGAFPEGTVMFASEVAASDVVDAVDEATDYDVTKSDVKAYDITFKKDGKEIQPRTAVEVSFKNVDLDGDELEVFHMEDTNAKAEPVNVVDAGDKDVTVEAESFSVYVVVSYYGYIWNYFSLSCVDESGRSIYKSGNYDQYIEYGNVGISNNDKDVRNIAESTTIQNMIKLGYTFQRAYIYVEKGSWYPRQEQVDIDKIKYDTSKGLQGFGEDIYKGNGSNTWYPLNQKTVYFEYALNTSHTVTFNTNGGSGTIDAIQATSENDYTVTLPEKEAVGQNGTKTFLGWATNQNETDSENILSGGAIYTASADVTLYAIWDTTIDFLAFEVTGSGEHVRSLGRLENETVTGTMNASDIQNLFSIAEDVYAYEGVYLESGNTSEKIGQLKKDKGQIKYKKEGENTLYTLPTDSKICVHYTKCEVTPGNINFQYVSIADSKNDDVEARDVNTVKYTVDFLDENNELLKPEEVKKIFEDNKIEIGDLSFDESVVSVNENTFNGISIEGYTFDNCFFYWEGAYKGAKKIVTQFKNFGKISTKYSGYNSYIGFLRADEKGNDYSGDTVGYYAYNPTGTLRVVFKPVSKANPPMTYYVSEGASVYSEKDKAVWNTTESTWEFEAINKLSTLTKVEMERLYPTSGKFLGWTTTVGADGNGTGECITDAFFNTKVNKDIYLYAKWSKSNTITYNANGGSGSMPKDTKAYGASYTIKDNGFNAPIGKEFAGWNTDANGSGTSYEVGRSYTTNADLTLYAQWKDIYTVAYDLNALSVGLENSNIQGVDVTGFSLVEGKYQKTPLYFGNPLPTIGTPSIN